MACSNGLAPGIDAALDLTPYQMVVCLEVLAERQNEASGGKGRGRGKRREGTPEEFAAMFMSASQGQVAVIGG
ncbi:MAG: hypothetical protein M3537_02175 [Chloroflexota bacterium]|nr:hypothetical protein [Chloroflexota bacterium]